MSERQTGTVKWFDNRKGYGFIQRDNVGDDVFVHFREIRGEGFKTLFEGQRVEFGLIERDKGYAAEDVAAFE
jgi:CspA family cold shock protein